MKIGDIIKGETVESYRTRLLDIGILQRPVKQTSVVHNIKLYKAVWWKFFGGYANNSFSPKLVPIKEKQLPNEKAFSIACEIMQSQNATWAKREEDDKITTDVRGDYFAFYTPDFLWCGTYFVETQELQYRPDKNSNKKAIIHVDAKLSVAQTQ